MKIGKLIQQPTGYKAFIPDKFPPQEQIILSPQTQQLHAKAVLMLVKLKNGLGFLVLDQMS